ncbi:MAG TPA: hypothetical protein DIW31_01610 [Bacteroidales bacterium]|nr:hypothetical protein [Bacteroidales bacterium]
MFIHIMTSENYYHISYIQLIERNFPTNEHQFIFRSKSFNGNNYMSTTLVKTKSNFISLFLFIPKLIKANKIYLHYLPYGNSLPFWLIFSIFSKKLVWIFWGGDIYIYREKNKNLKTRFYEKCRKIIIRRLKNIGGFLTEDYELIKEIYNTNAVYTKVIYPIPVDFSALSTNNIPKEGKTIHILVGNSADPSNNHFELLNQLSIFKDEDIQLICPLSYGHYNDYLLKVKEEGFRIFGDKFKPLLELLSTYDYGKILESVDIAVMNHQRQQGLGNLLSVLSLGKKVFVRSDTTSFNFFKAENITIWDTLEIKNLSFESFVAQNPDDAIRNKNLVLSAFSEQRYKELWNNIFSLK